MPDALDADMLLTQHGLARVHHSPAPLPCGGKGGGGVCPTDLLLHAWCVCQRSGHPQSGAPPPGRQPAAHFCGGCDG